MILFDFCFLPAIRGRAGREKGVKRKRDVRVG